MTGYFLRERAKSPDAYLQTPPMRVTRFVCNPEEVWDNGDRTYILPAVCTYPGRHHCGLQAVGHDPGDEDVRP